MNVAMLNKVIEYLAEEPRRLNMYYPVSGVDHCFLDGPVRRKIKTEEIPPCGTVCCLAGAAAIISGMILPKLIEERLVYMVDWWTTYRIAINALDLTEEQAEKLFYFKGMAAAETYSIGIHSLCKNYWPMTFETEYKDAKTSQERFEVTKRRIEHFIQTEGKE